MTILMYDSVDISQIPANPQAVAGYVGGFWPTYSLLVKKFPKALHKSIAVNASEDADILDVEAGDAVPSEAPAWVRRQQRRGIYKPGLYANASTMPAVVQALTSAGIKRDEVQLWLAHYTFVMPSPPFEQGTDAVQYTDAALGRNLDASACLPSFFDTRRPVHRNPPHYDWFYGPFDSPWGPLDEVQIVKSYDSKRVHPLLHPIALRNLKTKLRWLADRVAHQAHVDPVNGKPSWGKFRRGWRYQNLIHRAQGQRFV